MIRSLRGGKKGRDPGGSCDNLNKKSPGKLSLESSSRLIGQMRQSLPRWGHRRVTTAKVMPLTRRTSRARCRSGRQQLELLITGDLLAQKAFCGNGSAGSRSMLPSSGTSDLGLPWLRRMETLAAIPTQKTGN